MAIGCHSTRLGALPVTVTAFCPKAVTDVSDPNNPHVVQVSAIAHDLCVARYYVEQGLSNAATWVWNVLQSLEAELAKLWAWVKQGASNLWAWVQDLGGRVKNFLSWLDKQLGTAEKWILIGALVFLAIELAPAINDVASNARRK